MLKGKQSCLELREVLRRTKSQSCQNACKQHCEVHVLMTQNATNFINPITFETLTKHKCLIDTFDRNLNSALNTLHLQKRRTWL